jgi:hypothetical protein
MIREMGVGVEEDAHLLGGHPHHLGDVLDAEEHPPRRLAAARAEAQQVHVPDQLLPIDVLLALYRRLMFILSLNHYIMIPIFLLLSNCILIKVLHRELLVSRDIEADDLILFKVQLLVCQNVAHEAELGAFHGGQEHVHYDDVVMR